MRFWLSLLATLMIALSGFGADFPAPLKLVRTISLPNKNGRIDHFSIDLKHQIVFVAALGANAVVSVGLAHGKVLGSIPDLKEPQGVLYVPENGHLYIANRGDGSVRIYEASTLKQIKIVSLGDNADNIRYDAASKTIWVGYGSGAVAALDFDGNKLFDIPVGAHPEAFALEKSGNKMFVNVPSKKEVAVIDRDTRKLIGSYETGLTAGNYPMALDEANGRLFVGCRVPARLLVLDAANGKAVAELDTVSVTDDLFYDAAKHRIYVLGEEGFVVTYNQANANTYSEISRIPTSTGGRTGLFIPELGKLLVAIPRKGSQDAFVQVYQVQ
jgi:DNA-binding beta-propeller fold protein YncE